MSYMSNASYVDLKYKPNGSEVICEFKVEPAQGITLKEASNAVAGESSIGTWVDLPSLHNSRLKRLSPHVFSVNSSTNLVKIAYHPDLFEEGNIPQLLSSIGGNIFGMKLVKNLRLEDIHLPSSYVSSFKGPAFGIEGVRDILKAKFRPLIGTIIKPKLGLGVKDHAASAYESWLGGIDIVKDDENLTSMKFNKFRDRVSATLSKRDKAEKETGLRKVYMPNVTAEAREMISRAKYVKSLGGEYVMIDILTAGWSAVQTLREMDLGLVIHAHRAGHAMFTHNPNHGMSMLAIAKLARLIGVDQIHIGAIFGKMKGSSREVEHIGEEIANNFVRESNVDHVLSQSWKNIKPVFPVCSGGLHPGLIEPLVGVLGKDIIVQAGGGVHGHPEGTIAGAKAMRQAIDAVILRIPVKQYATTHRELRLALEKWS